MFFHLRIVRKSPAEISMPVGAVLELHSRADLTCLVNLAPRVIHLHLFLKWHLKFFKSTHETSIMEYVFKLDFSCILLHSFMHSYDFHAFLSTKVTKT